MAVPVMQVTALATPTKLLVGENTMTTVFPSQVRLSNFVRL